MSSVIEQPSENLMGMAIAGVGFSVDAPKTITDVLRATLSSVPAPLSHAASLPLTVRYSGESWEISGGSGARKWLDAKSSATQVAGALVSSAVTDVANVRSLRTLRATVIEIDGNALAMIGADWESTITIATHLHTRGWRYLSGDHALYDPATNDILGFEKALYVTSSSIGHLPVAYRGAIEASPWCVTRHGISFYAVNPALVGNIKPWAPSAPLRAVLFVDGRADDLPALETFGPHEFENERLSRLAFDHRYQSAAELTVGSYVETCDLIERWFASLDV